MTKTEARTRVARGAAYLDRVRPGWHDRIDVGTLTLHDPCGCIIGQLCGGYNAGLAKLFGVKPEYYALRAVAVPHGFDLSDEELQSLLPYTSRPADYQPLQDAWIEAIADRRFAGAVPETTDDLVTRSRSASPDSTSSIRAAENWR